MSNQAISKNFEHSVSEGKWYQHWLEKEYFNSNPDHRPSYTVVIPPPNVTGVLHMGHCLNNTIQDILIRRARQMGYNTCWVPGTDHASIATEAKVVQMLRERGIAKSAIGREEFLKYAWEWKEKYGGIILQQLKKLGCSLDWNRVNFTMDPDYYQSVISVFIDLYQKGYIYRGKRMINWDPKALTALSDEEVIMRETQSKLYHLRYAIADKQGNPTGEYITIATVRPETILGDTAIAVNPTDERYFHLQGKFALVPLINRVIPIITDDYVATDFGTGALKVTPAHDMNDYQLGEKHGLEVIDIMYDDGTFSEAAQLFIGEDRFAVRKKIVPELEATGHLIKIEDYTNQVGYSERSDAVVEPRLSLQWWVKMAPLAAKALAVVEKEEIKFHPAKFKNLYRHWMEGIKDWCISRQLWWGQRIPAWYLPDGRFYVAETKETAWEKYLAETAEGNRESSNINGEINEPFTANASPFSINDLQQDNDCLDTWFSSWLWPFEVFKGYSHPGNEDIKYYYPTATLVTAPEIIFFWVARMIMAGLEYQKEIPFRDVYFTGIVRDKQGRKMSKSLGNSPDLLALIDQYGADAVRFGILISSPAGNDILFDEGALEQGRNFNNKLWNALKLIKIWEERGAEPATGNENFANIWFAARLTQAKDEVALMLTQFRLSEALKTLYSLIWDDYCSWYLEWIKPPYGKGIDAADLQHAIGFYEALVTLLHPFMPFITEEIYHQLISREQEDDLCIKTLDENNTNGDSDAIKQGELLKKVITALRDARVKNNLKPKDKIQLLIETEEGDNYKKVATILSSQINADITLGTGPVPGAIAIAVEKDKFFISSEQAIDQSSQKEALLKDLAYQQNFLTSVEKKLSNEKFVQNAKPEVVAMEQKKKADALARIKNIEESLAAFA
jgi:valyl-tRNA synthetase